MHCAGSAGGIYFIKLFPSNHNFIRDFILITEYDRRTLTFNHYDRYHLVFCELFESNINLQDHDCVESSNVVALVDQGGISRSTVNSGQNKWLSINVESQFQDRYIKCNIN